MGLLAKPGASLGEIERHVQGERVRNLEIVDNCPPTPEGLRQARAMIAQGVTYSAPVKKPKQNESQPAVAATADDIYARRARDAGATRGSEK